MAEPCTGVPISESLIGGQLSGELPDPNFILGSHRNVGTFVTAASIAFRNSYILLISGPANILGDFYGHMDDLQALASQFFLTSLAFMSSFPLLPFSYSPELVIP